MFPFGIVPEPRVPVILDADTLTTDASCTALIAMLEATTLDPSEPALILAAVREVSAAPEPEWAPENVPAVSVPLTVPLDTKNVAPLVNVLLT